MLAELIILQGIIERGLIFALVVCGVFLTSRIIKRDDLTVEGSFGFGGACAAFCLMNNLPIWLSMLLSCLAGASAGLATGLLHTKLKLNILVSGIVIATALFSVNLKIAGSNMILNNAHTIFDVLPPIFEPIKTVLILVPLVLCIIFCIKWLLDTEIGFLLQAIGNNPQIVTNLGKNKDAFIILGLIIANTLTALAGALFVQYVGYFSIWASIGVLIISLASLIIAEQISKQLLISVIAGAIVFQTIIALTFELNIDQDWNKLITALLIIILTGAQSLVKKLSKHAQR